ncbi:MAG: cytochrome C-binding protein [Acidobacteria bacterium]|nr:MAG: cytochrome C-binding protein [Acidobacteriota bacterium]PYR78413.1 MAG: cytochrome C-binding protein [Acidobacteriota bacterium]
MGKSIHPPLIGCAPQVYNGPVNRRLARVVLTLAAVAAATIYVQGQGAKEPIWAYGFPTPPAWDDKAAPPQNPPARAIRPNEDRDDQLRPRRVEGSGASYSLLDIRDGHNVIDWFPGDHPSPMPDVIAHGPKKLADTSRGCGSCHLPNGKGRPENAQPGGLPYAYIVRQLQDFRLGFRRSADWRKANTPTMISLAMSMTDEEIHQAAAYFSAVKWNTRWVRVVETELVPKTHIQGQLFVSIASERTEPIAGRIIEMPADNVQAEELRNPHSGFVAYVPVGSIARGRDLVTTGGLLTLGNQVVQGKTTACAGCHGKDLMGKDDVPPLANRSPSYLARQLYDFQQGTRNGAQAPMMRPVVAHLTEEDIVAITAYLASLGPGESITPSPVTNTALR